MRRFFKLLGLVALVFCAAASGLDEAEENLILHLPCDELTDRGTPETAGGRWIATNEHTLVDGVAGKALQFQGYPDDGLMLGDLALDGPATVVMWVRSRDYFNDRSLLAQAAGPESQAGAMRLEGGLDLWDGEAWQLVVEDGLEHNVWMHLAVVFEDGKATGYLNGEAQRTIDCAFEFDGVEASLGGRRFGEHGTPYNGRLAELRIYRSALSADQIARLYRQTADSE